MATARRKPPQRRTPRRRPPPPTRWEQFVRLAKETSVVWGMVATMAAFFGGYVVRHFTMPERVPQIEAAVSKLANAEAARERKIEGQEDACTEGDLTFSRCSSLGFGRLHPDFAEERRK